MKSISRLLLAALTMTLAGCLADAPPTRPAGPSGPSPQQRMAQIDAVAGIDDTELNVQPLRDPEVEDLRESAKLARDLGNLRKAADDLNQALLLVADDPALLQERAEIALLQREYTRAETLSLRAVELGSQTGPLCRRHWATVEQSRLARGDTENAASAHAMIENCTVPGVLRM
ncbi:MAG: hypothetical protein LBV45_04555 [Xanthomonadaceae bacterium]|jgi:Flp pilus assembly protein TadD|nr:hypothetical protein [Xanthomonadaceae bacterium]